MNCQFNHYQSLCMQCKVYCFTISRFSKTQASNIGQFWNNVHLEEKSENFFKFKESRCLVARWPAAHNVTKVSTLDKLKLNWNLTLKNRYFVTASNRTNRESEFELVWHWNSTLTRFVDLSNLVCSSSARGPTTVFTSLSEAFTRCGW